MDATVARMHSIALSACTDCQGEEHFPHTPAKYRVTGMLAYSMIRPDLAIAWFDLTRGSVVVRIDGQHHWMWWFYKHDQADEHYHEEKRTMYLSHQT